MRSAITKEKCREEHNPYHTSVKFFVYHHFSHSLGSFVLSRIYVRKLGENIRPWAPFQITDSLPGPIVSIVDRRIEKKCVKWSIFSIATTVNILLSNHRAWIFLLFLVADKWIFNRNCYEFLFRHRLIWKCIIPTPTSPRNSLIHNWRQKLL